MQIHVARSSSQLGVFTAEEITAGLQSGRFLPSDLAWRDGLPNWTPLGDWAEFRQVTVPPLPPLAAGSAAPTVSTIPWEQEKSVGSFFATIKGVILSPNETLASGRYAFSDWLVFCYWAVLITLPFQVVGAYLGRNMNAELGQWLTSTGIPDLAQMGEAMIKSPQPPFWVTGIGLVIGLAFAPLIYSLFACFHWVGQKVFRLNISVERTVAVTLMVCSALIMVMAPVQLLRFSLQVQLVAGALLFIPFCVVYYRAFGVATGVNPWKQFLISCLVWFVLCCCCCAFPAMLLTMAGRAAAP